MPRSWVRPFLPSLSFLLLDACSTVPPPSSPTALPPPVPVAAAPAAEPESIESLLEKIEAAYRGGRHDEGLRLVQRVLELENKDLSLMDRLGTVYYRLGRPGEALGVWEQGLRLEKDPKRRADLERAVAVARRALGLPEAPAPPVKRTRRRRPPAKPAPPPPDPKGAEALYQEGVGHYARAEYFQAASLFQRALELDPGHARAKQALDRLRLGGTTDGNSN